MIDLPSPNHEPRPENAVVDMLLLHYTGMPSAEEALERLTDAATKVSSHYAIDEDGTIYRLVPESERAWHAGVSYWAGVRDINSRSIAIELVNPGHEFGYRPFPNAQMAALEGLAIDILRRHPISPGRVLGHSDVAPTRKHDPGELFDWARLARAGVGVWPMEKPPPGTAPGYEPGETVAAILEFQRSLARFGYEVNETGVLDTHTHLVTVAFQRHFRPRLVDGAIDAETRGRLAALLELLHTPNAPG